MQGRGLKMTKTKQSGRKRGVLLLGAVVAFASCSVDTSNIVFDDDLVNGGKGSGGTSASGGSASGGLAGEGGLGGDGSGGGSGGSTTGCSASELRCDGKQVQICAAGEWADVGGECPFACVDGGCTGVCEPRDTQCVSDTVVQTCNASGEWGEASVCEYACVGGDCAGECEPGSRRCGGTNGLRPQACDHQGAWVDARESDCVGSCDAATGSCSSCSAGETRCYSITQVQACSPPDWGAITTCPSACVGNSCGGTCVPGSRVCSSDYQYRNCGVTGELGAPVSCGNQACSGGQCVGECRPGTTRCSGSRIQECSSEGSWRDTTNCADRANPDATCVVYDGTPLCGVCIPGSQRCNGGLVQECTKAAIWEDSKNCDKESALCFEGVCRNARAMSTYCASGAQATGCAQEGTMAWSCVKGTLQSEQCTRLTSCSGNSGVCSR